MKREWQPGDVAMIPFSRGEVRAIFGADGWLLCDTPKVSGSRGFSGARPLVVIDPEDREQVEALRDVYVAAYEEQNPLAKVAKHGAMGNALQAALREFADPTPPRPDEPLGLGAVVEDAEGVRWLRMTHVPGTDYTPWAAADKSRERFDRRYADIAAVRILSEGVTP